ncbi:hypothetical protein ABMA28_015113 [Loxostege sticticalis]|uniref:Uncharacterized protein n=1 Tax=Loxostege sticticalis TaxID=481309 RepID=A0ABD0TEB0_LOXSC
MSTNSARLINSLECYMDDLVDCFEDFVKKSLVIISVAVGALIVMMGYLLKVVTDRSQVQMMGPPPGVPHRTDAAINYMQSAPNSVGPSRSNVQDDLQKSRSSTLPQKNTVMSFVKKDPTRTKSAAANTNPVSSVPSFDERVLRNIGLSSCSKRCLGKRSVVRNSSASRIGIPSMPTCIPNHHISTPRPCSKYITSRNSCCSMCCADDDRR